MTDTDNTGTTATAWYGDIWFSTKWQMILSTPPELRSFQFYRMRLSARQIF